MSTERLHLRDSFLLSFGGRLVRAASWSGKPALVLDRSAFYPEGGGQLGDRGTLRVGGASVTVVDTQIDDDGVVFHLVEALPEGAAEGAEVEGQVDGAHRRDFMSQHTAQHMLSAALLDVARAETISARLGASSSTIDVSLPGSLDDGLVHRAEDRVNDVVMSDAAIRVLFPTPDELRALPLRRQPKVDANIRVIDIEGFDCSPCGGTHCASAGQVGPLRVTAIERYKGLWRVTFLAGRRALADYRAKDQALSELARGFSCGIDGVGAAVQKIRADLRERQERAGVVQGELVRLLAEQALRELPAGGGRVVIAREGDDVGLVRALAVALARRPGVVAMVASREQKGADWHAVVERGAGASFDCGAWFKRASQRHGGRGGGKAERAEGKIPGALDWAAVAAEE